MSSKKIKFTNGLAYSTDSNMQQQQDDDSSEPILPSTQKLKVIKDSKQRAGKTVTLVQNFTGNQLQQELLCKALKNKCGCGGSAKDGSIILQGDVVAKAKQLLAEMGYTVV
jgi:translation initiation factor 1